jgi:HlyD family secretion protein
VGLIGAWRRRLIVAGIAIVVVGLAMAGVLFARRPPGPLVVTGIVDGNEIAVGAKVVGRIVRLPVHEGDWVEAGEVVAVIEHADLEAAVKGAAADVVASQETEQAARDQLALIAASTDAKIRQAGDEVKAAEAGVAQADANVQQADASYGRVSALVGEGVLTAQDLDNARQARDVAHAAADAARHSLAASQAGLADAQAQQKQVAAEARALDAAHAATARSKAEQEQARATNDQTTIAAPIDGVVSLLALREGEMAGPSTPILTIYDLGDSWVQADVQETDADRVALGQTVQVRLASGRLLSGPVIYKAVEADFATQRDVSTSKRDIKTVAIRVRIDNRDGRLARGTTAYVLLPARPAR